MTRPKLPISRPEWPCACVKRRKGVVTHIGMKHGDVAECALCGAKRPPDGWDRFWTAWVNECREMAGRGDEYPAEFASSGQKSRPRWVEFYNQGVDPRDAMERVNGRKMR